MKWNSESVKPYHTKLGKRGLGTKKNIDGDRSSKGND